MEAAIGIEPMNKGFADLCLTTWLRRLNARLKHEGGRMKSRSSWSSLQFSAQPQFSGCNTENRKLKTDSSSLPPLRSWSGRRDLNSRPSPWQGDALPLSYSRFGAAAILMIRCLLSSEAVLVFQFGLRPAVQSPAFRLRSPTARAN